MATIWESWIINFILYHFSYRRFTKRWLYKLKLRKWLHRRFGILQTPKLHEQILALNGYRSDVAKVLRTWRTPGYELALLQDSQRHFKTHLPFPLLPPSLLDTCKYVWQNHEGSRSSWLFKLCSGLERCEWIILNLIRTKVGLLKKKWEYYLKNAELIRM